MEKIIKGMVERRVLTDPVAVRGGKNPLGKISCEVFIRNMEDFKKGQIAFRDNPSLYHQLHSHASSCIKCGITLGEFLRK